MRIVVTKDDGEDLVFERVVDCYLAVRQEELYGKEGVLTSISETKSYSFGGNIRELVKEIAQSFIELQFELKNLRDRFSNGSS